MKSTSSDRSRARALAIAMHVLFFVMIVFGVSWQRKPPEPVQAELWSNLPPAPQARAVEPPPAPAPEPEPPKPVPRVTPPPPPKVVPTPAPKPEIALKKVEKKPEPKVEPKPVPKVEPKKRDDEKLARQQAEENARREQREADRKREATEKEAKAAADQVAAEKAAAEKAARAAAARDNQKYVAGIHAKVWARVALPPDLQGNPEAEFTVSLLPGGELQDVVMRRSSGNAAYDVAIERAIRQAQPFVVPSGDEFQRSFRRFPMTFRPQR